MSDSDTTTETTPEPTIEQIAEQVFGVNVPTIPIVPKPAEEEPKADPPKPDPAEEKVAARIAIAKRAELRAAEARAEIAAGQAEVERMRAEVAEMAKTADLVKAAKLSPSKALSLLGYDPKDFLEALAGEHEPAAVASRVVAESKGELDELRAELKALKEAQDERVNAAKAQQIEQQSLETQQQFLSEVETNAEKYPHMIAEFTPEEIIREGWNLALKHADAYHAQFGEYPTDDVIAEELESQAKARAERRGEWRARIGKKAPVPSEGKLTGDLLTTQPEPGSGPRTLTSRAASEKATAPKPWSQEQADEESLRILTQALKNAG